MRASLAHRRAFCQRSGQDWKALGEPGAGRDQAASTTETVARTRRGPGRPPSMEVNFGITLRGPAEPIPDQDARRVSRMRRLARARLNHCGLASMTDPVTLVVSELVTNAIMHSGGTQVGFRMQLRDGLLYLAVGSDAPGKPAVRKPNDEAEHGRGLQLVEFVVLGSGGVWGISDDGAAVWCLFPAKGEDR
ncbi:ATP-binding protein [Streptomyces rubrogriseus]